MTDEIFQEQAVTKVKAQLVDIIRESSVARRLYPQLEGVSASDGNFVYYKMKEQDNTQYAYELQNRRLSKYASQKVSTAIPIHQGDLHFTRHEIGRAAKDVFPMDARLRQLVESLVENEEKTAIYGDDDTGTILSDTTNISTAASAELDFGTQVEAMDDVQSQFAQLRTLLKNKFEGCILKYIWTSDVDARARIIRATTGNLISAYDAIGEFLVNFNGGGTYADHILVSDYLGSATAVGTTNTALVAVDPRNMALVTSPLEMPQGLDSLGNLDVQVCFRSKPIFYRGNDAVIYGGTAVLTP